MRIKNVMIYQENQTFCKGEVVVEHGKIAEIILEPETMSIDLSAHGDNSVAMKLEQPEDKQLDSAKTTDVSCGNEVDTSLRGETGIVDGDGCYMIPGLVDLHFHGCMGADLCDGEVDAIAQMASYEASVGVTTICPATMTIPEQELHQAMRAAGAFADAQARREESIQNCKAENDKLKNQKIENGKLENEILEREESEIRPLEARFAGINMEGPFISKAKKGAQAAENIIACDVELYRSYQKDSGNRIRIVDLAPEEDGAMEFIREVKDEVVISLAHTMADYDISMEAFAQGASHVTHLYNAMPPLGHRDPGVVGAARDTKECHVELICDGIHIHPSMIRATFSMFGANRVIMISDSMRATGLADGTYTLGGQAVTVRGNEARLSDGTIAGSVTNLMDCVRYAVRVAGIPLEDAIAAATANPAREIGIYDECGSISAGKRADFVLLNERLELEAVYVAGERVGRIGE